MREDDKCWNVWLAANGWILDKNEIILVENWSWKSLEPGRASGLNFTQEVSWLGGEGIGEDCVVWKLIKAKEVEKLERGKGGLTCDISIVGRFGYKYIQVYVCINLLYSPALKCIYTSHQFVSIL